MKSEEISKKLISQHNLFIDYISRLSEEDFNSSYQEKWTAGQQLGHIVLSLKPLAKILFFPKFMIKRKFGKANRESKTYDALVEKYLSKLQAGGTANTPFRPAAIGIGQRTELIKEILKSVKRINRRVGRYTEADLDYYILPHPLLGKLTFREMLYFTIYHVQHHEEIARRNLSAYKVREI